MGEVLSRYCSYLLYISYAFYIIVLNQRGRYSLDRRDVVGRRCWDRKPYEVSMRQQDLIMILIYLTDKYTSAYCKVGVVSLF